MRVGAPPAELFAVPVLGTCACVWDLLFSHFYSLRWQQWAISVWEGDHVWRRHERACDRLVARTHPERHGEHAPFKKESWKKSWTDICVIPILLPRDEIKVFGRPLPLANFLAINRYQELKHFSIQLHADRTLMQVQSKQLVVSLILSLL